MFKRLTTVSVSTKIGVAAALVAGSLVVSGVALAYFTDTGTGTGGASVGSPGTLTVNQTTVATGLYPGDSIPLEGDFTLAGSSPVDVTSLSASVTSVTNAGTANGGCATSNFQITGTPVLPGEIQPGTDVGSWSGLSISMSDPASNQDDCIGATPVITYSVTP